MAVCYSSHCSSRCAWRIFPTPLLQQYEIRDKRIAKRVDRDLEGGYLWPNPLTQLNPSFEPGEELRQLVDEGLLHEECLRIFRPMARCHYRGRIRGCVGYRVCEDPAARAGSVEVRPIRPIRETANET